MTAERTFSQAHVCVVASANCQKYM